jgi:hypothetical protein
VANARVLAVFDFKPGNENLPGRLFFNQEGVKGGSGSNVVALKFAKGTLHVVENGVPQPVDTTIPFLAKDWNHFELRFDFSAHTVEIVLNKKSAGTFKLGPEFTRLNQLNFFGGGSDFESAMDNLSITSTVPSGK